MLSRLGGIDWNARGWAEVAHQMALLPLSALTAMRLRFVRRDAAWWWLAAAFAVSWLADTAAHVLPSSAGWVPSVVYPVVQAGLVAAVLMPRVIAWLVLGGLMGIALVAAVRVSASGPDVVLRSAADLTIVAIAIVRVALPVALRASLLVTFGFGWLAWLAFSRHPALPAWYLYQCCRLAGLVLFCAALRTPKIHLWILT